MKRRFYLTSVVSGFLFALTMGLSPTSTVADDLVSLDGSSAPAAANSAPAGDTSLDSLDGTSAASAPAAGGDAEVSLDLGGAGAKSGDFFNPYVFSRNPLWILLPLFGMLIVVLHLLPVPKRKAKRQIDQAKRFFRGISGEGTMTGVIKNYSEIPAAASTTPVPSTETSAHSTAPAEGVKKSPHPETPVNSLSPEAAAYIASKMRKKQPLTNEERTIAVTNVFSTAAQGEDLEIIEAEKTSATHEFEPIMKKKKEE